MFEEESAGWIKDLYRDVYPTAPIYPVGPRNTFDNQLQQPANLGRPMTPVPQRTPMPQLTAPQFPLSESGYGSTEIPNTILSPEPHDIQEQLNNLRQQAPQERRISAPLPINTIPQQPIMERNPITGALPPLRERPRNRILPNPNAPPPARQMYGPPVPNILDRTMNTPFRFPDVITDPVMRPLNRIRDRNIQEREERMRRGNLNMFERLMQGLFGQ